MKMMITKLLFLMCIFSVGCVVRPAGMAGGSPLLELPKKKDSAFVLQEQKGSEKAGEVIDLYLSPDRRGIPLEQSWSKDLGMERIVMQVISQWDDGSLYHVTIQFINPTDDSLNGNLNLYAYDRLGRLIRTEFGGTIGFRANSVSTREYSFTKRGKEVRWIVSLTGKK